MRLEGLSSLSQLRRIQLTIHEYTHELTGTCARRRIVEVRRRKREARVKRSDRRICTTHVGSLPRPDDLMALFCVRNAPDETPQPRLRAAVGDIVRQQAESGIDVINDGEHGKAMRTQRWTSVPGGPTSTVASAVSRSCAIRSRKKGRAGWTFGSKERQRVRSSSIADDRRRRRFGLPGGPQQRERHVRPGLHRARQIHRSRTSLNATSAT